MTIIITTNHGCIKDFDFKKKVEHKITINISIIFINKKATSALFAKNMLFCIRIRQFDLFCRDRSDSD